MPRGAKKCIRRFVSGIYRTTQHREFIKFSFECMLSRFLQDKDEESLIGRFNRVLEMKKAWLGETSTELARVWNIMGVYYRHIFGKYDKSLECYDKAEDVVGQAIANGDQSKDTELLYAGLLWQSGMYVCI